MMAKCNHENIAKFYGLELIENTSHRYAMAMEFCADGNLQEMIDANQNGLEPSEFFRVVEHVVTAIEHLHSQQILVRHDNYRPMKHPLHCMAHTNIYTQKYSLCTTTRRSISFHRIIRSTKVMNFGLLGSYFMKVQLANCHS